MSTEKDQTLDQVREAQEAIEDARADEACTPQARHALEAAALKLRNIERSIIEATEQDLVAALTADAAGLSELADEVSKCADKLAHTAATINKAAKAVESLISAVTNIAGAGLI